MGSTIQDAISPAVGYARGFLTCGLISLACGMVGMMLIRPGVDILKRFRREPGGRTDWQLGATPEAIHVPERARQS